MSYLHSTAHCRIKQSGLVTTQRKLNSWTVFSYRMAFAVLITVSSLPRDYVENVPTLGHKHWLLVDLFIFPEKPNHKKITSIAFIITGRPVPIIVLFPTVIFGENPIFFFLFVSHKEFRIGDLNALAVQLTMTMLCWFLSDKTNLGHQS